MSSSAEAAADVFQAHRDELGFVNRAQCQEGDLYTVERDGQVVAAALGNHCVRKPQTTLYELAVLPEYRRRGIASELIARMAWESPHEKIVAKCPVGLPANEFYRADGWTRVGVEDGKNRDLAVWEKDISRPDRITTGRDDLTAIAARYGWLRGSRMDDLGRYEKRDISLSFIDLHWSDPDPAALLSAAKRHRPEYVVAGDYDEDAGDYEEINDRARQLRDYAENVIVVPHASEGLHHVPEWAVVGYSTPSDYAATSAPMWEYQAVDQPIHILGGTPEQMRHVAVHLGDSVQSFDMNSHHLAATQYAKWWGGSTPRWNRLPTTVAASENAAQAYENSIMNLTYSLRAEGLA